jgi:hypothetical protein
LEADVAAQFPGGSLLAWQMADGYRGGVSTLTEIEDAAAKLSPTQQEELIRFLTSRLEQRPIPPTPYRTRTHAGRVRDGLDADKLAQLADDL